MREQVAGGDGFVAVEAGKDAHPGELRQLKQELTAVAAGRRGGGNSGEAALVVEPGTGNGTLLGVHCGEGGQRVGAKGGNGWLRVEEKEQ